ncbi:hypothetical protein EGT74_24345 [Chitinophaga lutea]|uniref:Uncharacterized protein n=1 Tax=Chitinophaga lutea TaxID=2488634 RepID=A0A3N4PDL7_9BACT|nr:hypothetical protein [Chitinophaga lutea]RPE05518.1 hypothetical protein EGT74_24345 [Chitinophaga lutea]
MKKRKEKKYSGFKIQKKDAEGKVIETYESTLVAMRNERVSHKVLIECIKTGAPHKGFTFSYGDKGDFKKRVPKGEAQEPSEELFDVDRFGEHYNCGRWEENSSIQPLKFKSKLYGL